MSQNKIYDVAVIGATAEGAYLCECLKSKANDLEIALISKVFDIGGKIDLTGVDLINEEAVFSSYNHGLIGFTLKSKAVVFCRTAVIATGTKPMRSAFKSNGIYYKASDIKSPSKTRQAVVYGNGKDAAEYALAISKKFKYVYLCTSAISVECPKRLSAKLDATANVVTLPGCNVVGVKNDKEGNLTEVTLDTYETIHCSALVFALGRRPDVSGISKKMIELDEVGYAITKGCNETTKVPGIYAIGACARHNTKQSITGVANAIIAKRRH